MDLSDKLAIVTGGGKGIGRGIVLALAGHGADVVVADIDTGEARKVAETVANIGRRSLALWLDVTDMDSIDGLVARTIEHFGKIDILVNNAGVAAAPDWENRISPNGDDWDWTFKVNLKGIAMMTDAVVPHMIKQLDGKIVNVSSTGGRQGAPENPPYLASKAGVINLTQSAALQLAAHNINVNAICPGAVWTDIGNPMNHFRSNIPGETKGLSSVEIYEMAVQHKIPLRRAQTPEDMGHLAAFLASDYARNITGQSINVNGGSRMD